jgi:putative flippase GtrA
MICESILTLMRFGVVGVCALSLHWIVVCVLVPLGLSPLVSNVIGFLCAVTVSYQGHRVYTFHTNSSNFKIRMRFFILALGCFVLNELLYAMVLEATDLDYRVALLWILGTVACVTFVVSKYWVFKR